MLAPWKKSYDQPRQHIKKKQRHYFTYSGPYSQNYVFFPVVMCGCESWTIKQTEHQRINAFQLWCWRRPLRVPWTIRSNQSILKESVLNIHWKDWCWSWSSILWPPDMKNWLIGKRPWCWARLNAGGEGDNWRWDGWMVSLTWWTWVSVNFRSCWWSGKPGVLQYMGHKESNMTEQLN